MTSPLDSPRARDMTRSEALRQIERLRMTLPGVKVYVKWTCPGCGERVTANVANEVNAEGYVHMTKLDGSPCGAQYRGDRYGLLLFTLPTGHIDR